MKIKEIKEKEDSFSIYVVTLRPNWVEKLFGVKEKVCEYKDTGDTYRFGGGHVYLKKNGTGLGNGHWISDAIDIWRRRW
jgi:hypothetical protein